MSIIRPGFDPFGGVDMSDPRLTAAEGIPLESYGRKFVIHSDGTITPQPPEPPKVPNPGYHIRLIQKGTLGEPSKIFEEVEEFRDALEQGVSIMALVELSDLMGAISAYLEKYHPSMTMDDLQKMRSVTERAFKNGRR